MGAKFWKGMQRWGRHLMRHGVFEKKELGFGRLTDSPSEVVELIVRSMPLSLRKLLKPQKQH
jgi:predicted Rossmann-fold nucleotide-binding protein